MDRFKSFVFKEFNSFFVSPVAYIFLGAFLAVSLFVFFWVENFFSRNISDVRPLFEWMPVLLIFLVAALTMRAWSEERRSGTLEGLLTLPIPPWQLVLGKFLASLALVAMALALTFPLVFTVSFLGNLDAGPVFGGYLAALLLGGAYVSIGLFVSSRTDNQIVSLLGTVLVAGAFYMVGSPSLTHLFGHHGGEILKLLGSGSRFESITRGVLDWRDLYYYLSLIGVFLALNAFSLERLRWAPRGQQIERHYAWSLALGLLVGNLVAANLWLQGIGWLRVDLTQGHIYSLSSATREYLTQLREPMLIRGYFSAQTHPELAPLVPQLRDLLKEYELSGAGNIRVEFVDPLENPELEQEAGEKYGIKPVAFQTSSKYQAAVVNSYFDILVRYGDQYEKLGFRDLIEVKAAPGGDLEVRLRNPEYDLTRAIKKTLYAYQRGGDAFSGLTRNVQLKGFVSPAEKMPQPLEMLRHDLDAVAAELVKISGGKLQVDLRDPDAGDGSLAKDIEQHYGFRPLTLGLLDPNSFYFYLVLESSSQSVPVTIPQDLSKDGLKKAIESGLKRFAPGLLRTVALYTPDKASSFGMARSDYSSLEAKLKDNARVLKTDLKTGAVPDETDLLVVMEPRALDRKQLFAIDQYLMQGGSLVLAASPFAIEFGGQAIAARPAPTGLEDWLKSLGLEVAPRLVLDPQNTPFPIPVQRQIGGFVVQEIRSLAYPYFPDLREDGMNAHNGITSGLGQLTLNWASPIQVKTEAQQERQVIELLHSSSGSWSAETADIQPNFNRYPDTGFPSATETKRQLLGVAVEGRFRSFFAGQRSPLLTEEAAKPEGAEAMDETEPAKVDSKPRPAGVVELSPANARIILIGSASAFSDTALDLAMEATSTRYIKPLLLLENSIDWSLEDRGLLSLRGRGQYSRMLMPMEKETQIFLENLNYVLAVAGLVLIYWLHRRLQQRRRARYLVILQGGQA